MTDLEQFKYNATHHPEYTTKTFDEYRFTNDSADIVVSTMYRTGSSKGTYKL